MYGTLKYLLDIILCPKLWADCAKKAGISGYKTNHSLHVTSSTRLFQSGVDEQLIMLHTGHRSVDGVCTYKRESEHQKRSLSTVLNSASNGNPMPYGMEIQKQPKLDNWTENELS